MGRRQRSRDRAPVLDGEGEAQLVAIACSEPHTAGRRRVRRRAIAEYGWRVRQPPHLACPLGDGLVSQSQALTDPWRWRRDLLADELKHRKVVHTISHETVRKVLKKKRDQAVAPGASMCQQGSDEQALGFAPSGCAKETLKGRQEGARVCIPPQQDAAFVRAMEQVLRGVHPPV